MGGDRPFCSLNIDGDLINDLLMLLPSGLGKSGCGRAAKLVESSKSFILLASPAGFRELAGGCTIVSTRDRNRNGYPGDVHRRFVVRQLRLVVESADRTDCLQRVRSDNARLVQVGTRLWCAHPLSFFALISLRMFIGWCGTAFEPALHRLPRYVNCEVANA